MAHNEHCVIQVAEHTAIIQRTILYHFVSSKMYNVHKILLQAVNLRIQWNLQCVGVIKLPRRTKD